MTSARRLGIHTVPFTLLLGALVTLASFATDMGLPVLDATAASLGVTPGQAALTLGVFMAGYALGPLLSGPLSDHYGRRPVLLVACATFTLFGALAAFSRTLGALLAWRFFMGAGAGGCQVMVVAMVRDLFAGPEARVRQSYVNLAAGVAPIVAPTLGVGVAALGGWRAIYGALAAGGALLLAVAALQLDESRPAREGATLSLRRVLASYARVLAHPLGLGYALVVALNFGSLFAWVSGSSLVLIGVLGVSRRLYAAIFAVISLGIMAGALVSARLSRRGVSHARLIGAGMIAITGTALLLVAMDALHLLHPALLVPVVVVGYVGQGVVRPNAVQGALEPLPEIAGVASAVLSAVQMVIGSAASATVASLFDGRTAHSTTGTMAVTALASAAVYLLVVRRAERHRSVPHEPSPFTRLP